MVEEVVQVLKRKERSCQVAWTLGGGDTSSEKRPANNIALYSFTIYLFSLIFAFLMGGLTNVEMHA